MPGHAQQRLNRKMEPEGPLPPQPPELTARYNKKVLTLEEIVQAHANSEYAQKTSTPSLEPPSWTHGGSLVPDGGRIFHDVKDVSDLKKDAVGIKDLLQEVDVLQLGGWGDSEFERFAALLAPMPPDAAGRVAVDPVSMRRAFWGKAGPRGFPHLAVAANRLLGVHATSAASERNWSAWGRLFTSARTRLTLERAKMLIYIKANAGLGARHSTEAPLLARMGE
ncbi:hypothetical protein QJQ45_009727 [Haematococcus lacustris]|nr:hypothetical protein QJQ45_009727 [Haematococcus lacustris]